MVRRAVPTPSPLSIVDRVGTAHATDLVQRLSTVRCAPLPTLRSPLTKHQIMSVRFEVNGKQVDVEVEPRMTLADCLRQKLRLTGTHLGCEHGVCGACTVIVDGAAVRSCLMLAVQAEGAKVVTVEGLSNDADLTPLQKSFRKHHALQCGFCTPGMLTTAHALLSEEPDADKDRIREVLSGNLCRCTGYINIIEAVYEARSAYKK
jgi:aerobic-type carbon monoxide dehydrogenase small subunit (CoxS/CutS family)